MTCMDVVASVSFKNATKLPTQMEHIMSTNLVEDRETEGLVGGDGGVEHFVSTMGTSEMRFSSRLCNVGSEADNLVLSDDMVNSEESVSAN